MIGRNGIAIAKAYSSPGAVKTFNDRIERRRFSHDQSDPGHDLALAMSIFRNLKEAALEKAVVAFARSKFERYGELRSIKIDTADQSLSAEVLLKGEPEPVTISHAKYRIESKGEQKVLIISDVRISKEWAQNLLEDRFQEITIPVPDMVSSLLG